MQKTIIKTWLVVLLMGVSPSYAQSKQANTPEKPWYVGETFISTVVAGFVIALVGYAGGMIIGGSKKVSEADKQNFENRILEKVTIIVDTKIAANEKIKGLELQNILLGIQNSIENLTTEIHNMNKNHESHKESVARRFDEVHKNLNNQERNSEKVVERVNQALQNAFGEYGVSVPPIQVRRRDSNPHNYDIHSDEGNIG
jgi:hypothetical protein